MSGDRDDSGHGEDRRDESFASRWSRLKGRAKSRPAEDAEQPAGEAAGPPPVEDRTDEEILDELGLPDPETLKPGDNFKAFMASAVPARIRNRALRRLWTSNPVLANLDRLVDYDDDFTDAAMVREILSTGYKVGRGWLEDEPDKNAEEASTQPEANDETSVQEESLAGTQEAAEPTKEPAQVGKATAAEEAVAGQAQAGEGDGDPTPGSDEVPERSGGEARGAPQRRRMRFRFTNA